MVDLRRGNDVFIASRESLQGEVIDQPNIENRIKTARSRRYFIRHGGVSRSSCGYTPKARSRLKTICFRDDRYARHEIPDAQRASDVLTGVGRPTHRPGDSRKAIAGMYLAVVLWRAAQHTNGFL